MTIDKFGRHVFKHVIKKHLKSHSVVRELMKHPAVKEVITSHITSASVVGVTKPRQTVMTLYSDGTLFPNQGLYQMVHSDKQMKYINKFYTGEAVNLWYSDKNLVELLIHDPKVNKWYPAKPPFIVDNTTQFILKYVGPQPPLPIRTGPVAVEILLQDDG